MRRPPLLPRAAAAVMLTVAGSAAIAVADGTLPFGGGAGIIVDGSDCTLTTIGHDRAGELVGFTAAHCGGPGAQVVAEGSEDRGPLGSVVAAGEHVDYAVIKFDPAKVTPIANFDGFAINGVGPDPGFGEPACQQGGATGVTCGSINLPTVNPGTINGRGLSFQPGDDGAPVTVNSLLVGMTRSGYTAIDPGPIFFGAVPHIKLLLFSTVLADVSANGGPGAGFTPIGS